MQDLVRVGVADAAQDARVGERALERVIRRGDARGEDRGSRGRRPRDRPGRARPAPRCPRTTCSEARRLVPASVSVSEPLSKSNVASAARRLRALPAAYQCRRPAIIRCSTSQSSPSTPIAIRLPSLRTSRTTRPASSCGDGAKLRSRNGFAIVTRSRRWPDDARRDGVDVDGDVGQLGHRTVRPSRASTARVQP